MSTTVAPNLALSPDSFETSITSALADQVLELVVDAALVQALRFLGRMVFGVFREIAMRARFRDRLDDARPAPPAGASAAPPERVETWGGHRNLVHLNSTFLPLAVREFCLGKRGA